MNKVKNIINIKKKLETKSYIYKLTKITKFVLLILRVHVKFTHIN